MKSQVGFSLIELLIAIAMLVLVMLALFALYDNYGSIFGSQQALFNIAGSASTTVTELQQTIMQADAITSHTFASGAYSSGANTLVLELPAVEADGDLLPDWDYVAFYVSGSKVYKLTEAADQSFRADSLKELSNTVSALTFTYDNIDLTQATRVDIDLTTQARSGHQTQTYNLQQQVYLRNN